MFFFLFATAMVDCNSSYSSSYFEKLKTDIYLEKIKKESQDTYNSIVYLLTSFFTSLGFIINHNKEKKINKIGSNPLDYFNFTNLSEEELKLRESFANEAIEKKNILYFSWNNTVWNIFNDGNRCFMNATLATFMNCFIGNNYYFDDKNSIFHQYQCDQFIPLIEKINVDLDHFLNTNQFILKHKDNNFLISYYNSKINNINKMNIDFTIKELLLNEILKKYSKELKSENENHILKTNEDCFSYILLHFVVRKLYFYYKYFIPIDKDLQIVRDFLHYCYRIEIFHFDLLNKMKMIESHEDINFYEDYEPKRKSGGVIEYLMDLLVNFSLFPTEINPYNSSEYTEFYFNNRKYNYFSIKTSKEDVHTFLNSKEIPITSFMVSYFKKSFGHVYAIIRYNTKDNQEVWIKIDCAKENNNHIQILTKKELKEIIDDSKNHCHCLGLKKPLNSIII
jgi:hypothetical protein